jgi:hypothetical protein
MALFTEDTHFVVYMDARNAEPTQDLHGREALAPVFDALNAYVVKQDGAWLFAERRLMVNWTDTRPSVS